MSFKSIALGATALMLAGAAATQAADRPIRPVNTYSIVARDAATGELGVAVQSHWFSVGSVVIWAEPGIGAVATQSFVLPDYGPNGLALMRGGASAAQALEQTLAADAHIDVRQVAMVDAHGGVAVHTGENAIAEHCHITGEGYSVQANMMRDGTVCTAMSAAFEASTGPLSERLMLALEAAQGEGGDIRGKQSAAMLVVSGDAELPAWSGRLVDLRVEDNPDPLVELRRLLGLSRVYGLMQAGDDAMAEGDMAAASAAYASASALAPDNHEVVFWHAITLATGGDMAAAAPLFSRAFAAWPQWRDIIARLRAAGILPDDDALEAQILAVE
jgi:uncharacterized Ntn-hydrolase superfamily protein